MHISSKKELDETIIELEKRLIAQEQTLRINFEVTKHSLKPTTLFKRAASKVINSPSAKSTMFKVVGGLAATLLAKRLINNRKKIKEKEKREEWERSNGYRKPEQHSFAGNIFKTLVKAGLTKAVLNNSVKFMSYGTAIFNNVFNSNHKQNRS